MARRFLTSEDVAGARDKRIVVDESTIEENKPPLLVYREAAKQA